MTYDIERPSPCLVRLKASVPAAEAESVRTQVTREFAASAALPGFRRGKAPLALVVKRFAQEIRQETEERLLRRVWDEAVTTERLRVAGPLGWWRPAGKTAVVLPSPASLRFTRR
jgi:FKBP-type peptidyl-prolyl cis-trans isomerase (trigger factor)